MPNELCAELHNRMPVVLKPETWPVWLGEEPAVASALKALLTPFPSDEASRTLRTSSGPTLRADHTAIDTAHPKVVDRNIQASVGRMTDVERTAKVRR
jgi:putative SOS response-associated peptidase YedK